MGRQVNFFMHPDDLAEFDAMLKARGHVCFLENKSPGPKPVTRQRLLTDATSQPRTIYLVQERYLHDVRTIAINARTGEQFHLIDEGRSPVVELLPSAFDGNVIGRGRLHFLPGDYDSDHQYMNKPADFLKWGDSLLRWIRRHYRRHPNLGWYVGPHAALWVSQDGGQLSPL
jgi:hypothetical protein